MWREALLLQGHTKVKEAQWELLLASGTGGRGWGGWMLSPQSTGSLCSCPSTETQNHKFSRQDWGVNSQEGPEGKESKGEVSGL